MGKNKKRKSTIGIKQILVSAIVDLIVGILLLLIDKIL